MKKLSIFFIVILIVFGCTDQNKATDKNKTPNKVETNTQNNNDAVWFSNLEDAMVIAQKEDKPILLQFSGSDWCRWCIKLNNEVLQTKEFTDYAKDNIVLVNLDYPRTIPQTDKVKQYNQKMLQKYGIRGFPAVLLLDKDGKLVLHTGYQPGGPSAYIKHIKDAYASK